MSVYEPSQKSPNIIQQNKNFVQNRGSVLGAFMLYSHTVMGFRIHRVITCRNDIQVNDASKEAAT